MSLKLYSVLCASKCWCMRLNKIICNALDTWGSFQHLALLLTGRTEACVHQAPWNMSEQQPHEQVRNTPRIMGQRRTLLASQRLFLWYNKNKAESWTYISYQLKVWKEVLSTQIHDCKYLLLTLVQCIAELECCVVDPVTSDLPSLDTSAQDAAETHATAASLLLSFSLSFVLCATLLSPFPLGKGSPGSWTKHVSGFCLLLHTVRKSEDHSVCLMWATISYLLYINTWGCWKCEKISLICADICGWLVVSES